MRNLRYEMKQNFVFTRVILNFSQNAKTNTSKPFVSKLTNRSLLIMNGPDTYKLLQGLTTNDINILKTKNSTIKSQISEKQKLKDKICIYTLFLSPKGKLITDAFIYKPKVFQKGKRQFRQDQLWIDVHTSLKSQLVNHLKKYMWKKSVSLVDVDLQQDENKPFVYTGYNHLSTISSVYDQGYEVDLPNQKYRDDEYSNLMFFDPRGSNYGRRILCMQEQIGLPIKEFNIKDSNQYENFQGVMGFTPSTLTTKKLPFQFNYDLLNSISFKKGCYLGQEIVSRSYFTGIVRRRVFPFMVQNQPNLTQPELELIVEGAKLLNSQKEQLGKIIYYQKGRFGLALINYLQYFDESKAPQNRMQQFEIKEPFLGSVYCPFQNQLGAYLTQTKNKQKNLEQLDI